MNLKELFQIMQEDVANSHHLSDAYLSQLEKVVSDGYHTFDELYEHRITLYIALCKQNKSKAWRSVKHSDGTSYEGWFVLGLNKEKGEQITYHLPMSKWQECDNWCETLGKAPEFDGHTPDQVLERIKIL